MADAKTHIHQEAAPTAIQDRVTIILSGNYREAEGDMKDIRYAYDRTVDPVCSPFQNSQRLNPGTPVKVNVGDALPGQFEVFLGHQQPKLTSDASGLIADAQKNNKIVISDANGVELATILPGRACMGQFTGELYATATQATTLLHVTVFPV